MPRCQATNTDDEGHEIRCQRVTEHDIHVHRDLDAPSDAPWYAWRDSWDHPLLVHGDGIPEISYHVHLIENGAICYASWLEGPMEVPGDALRRWILNANKLAQAYDGPLRHPKTGRFVALKHKTRSHNARLRHLKRTSP